VFLPIERIGLCAILCSIISILSLLSRRWLLQQDEALYFILVHPVGALNRISATWWLDVVGKLMEWWACLTGGCPLSVPHRFALLGALCCGSWSLACCVVPHPVDYPWLAGGDKLTHLPARCVQSSLSDLNLVLRRTAAAVRAPLRSCPRYMIKARIQFSFPTKWLVGMMSIYSLQIG